MHLEHSSQVSFEAFHVELIKALSVILTRIDNLDGLLWGLESPELYCGRIMAFLTEFAKRAVESATREWACYAMTLLCLKLLAATSARAADAGLGARWK